MSILNTKPRYFPSAVATESGWINPVTKELLVSVGGLKSRLEKEFPTIVVKVPPVVAPTPEPVITPVKEEPIVIIEEPKQRKPYAPRKPKIIGEIVEPQLAPGTAIIGEVVEYDLDTTVLGE
jgi:hypothetical protein